jgi:hypothetical protein
VRYSRPDRGDLIEGTSAKVHALGIGDARPVQGDLGRPGMLCPYLTFPDAHAMLMPEPLVEFEEFHKQEDSCFSRGLQAVLRSTPLDEVIHIENVLRARFDMPLLTAPTRPGLRLVWSAGEAR